MNAGYTRDIYHAIGTSFDLNSNRCFDDINGWLPSTIMWLIRIKKKKHSTFTIHLKFQPNFFLFSGFKLLILFNMWHIWIVNNRPLFLSVLTWYIARLVRSHVKSILKWHGHWCPTSIPTTLDIFKNWNHTNNNAKYVVPQSPLNVRCTEYGVHEVI